MAVGAAGGSVTGAPPPPADIVLSCLVPFTTEAFEADCGVSAAGSPADCGWAGAGTGSGGSSTGTPTPLSSVGTFASGSAGGAGCFEADTGATRVRVVFSTGARVAGARRTTCRVAAAFGTGGGAGGRWSFGTENGANRISGRLIAGSGAFVCGSRSAATVGVT